MRFNPRFTLSPLAALLLATFGVSAHAAEQWVSTETKAPRASESAVHVAAMQAGAATHVTVSLKLQNKAELDKLTADIMAGKARPLTSAQFMGRYAPTDAQVQAVVTHLRNAGFTNITVSDNRMLINADGSAAAVKAGFNTELHTYNVNGRSARANTSDAQVPASLANVVLAVHGLQDIYQHHTMAKPLATTMATTGHNPTDFPLIYNASSLPSATNATIGIITQGSMTQTITDLKSFASSAGYPAPNVSVVQVGSASSDTSGVGEWNMDTQDALAAAGGTIKQMLLYTATTLSDTDLTNTYNKAVTDNLAKAINVSLGECENDAKASGIMASNDQIFQTAVAQGQMFSVSSGDSGAWECGATTGKAQSYPAVSPYVMAIGGTTLSTSGTTWTGETVWSCSSASTCQQSSSGGAGGGPSLTEAAPTWQKSAGVLGTSTMRGVPDISFDAAPSSGALVLINGANQQIGGTSLAAPIFTGFWARVQSANGNSLPFPASKLYASAAANPSMFHDVTSGNQGYAAAAGWDYASGYGSLNVANFASVMAGSGSSLAVTNPSNLTVAPGGTATFSVSASGGTSPYSYQWYRNGSLISGATSATYSFVAQSTDNGATFYATVTDSASPAHTATSATATLTVGTTQLTERMVNGGFESGTTGWTGTTGDIGTFTGETAHSGTKYAWLDGYGSSHNETIQQAVAIPSTSTQATLSFWLHIDTAETTTTTAYDKLTVTLKNSSGTVLKTLGTWSNLNAASGYKQYSFDVSAYKGQTVYVTFNGVEDSSLQTSFVIDDVSLMSN